YTLAAVGLLLPLPLLAFAVARWQARRPATLQLGETTAPPPPARPRLSPPLLLAIAALPPFLFVTVFHFGKAGYVLSYLPALVLLLLWPASRLAGPQRLVATGVVAVVCAVQLLRFAGAPGLLPESMVDGGGPWFTRSRFGAPYRLTAASLRSTDDDVERHLALGRTFDPASDELVYAYMNGGHRFRHSMLTLPQFRQHYLQLGFHEWVTSGRRWHHERDHVLELAPGHDAVLVVDDPGPEVLALVDQGVARPIQLDTGPTVYVVPPGVTVYGVHLTTGPAPATPG
ncbi:MAG: hypothetical protein ACRD0S_00695, partial [Acidimicrobiales bacterium]